MATTDAIDRQRPALPPISHLDLDKTKPERLESRFPPINTINTSTPSMGSPNAPYPGPPPPYTYTATNGTTHSGYVSPPESTTRRSTREEENMEKTSPRKSLPSIHEALGEGKGLPPLTTPSHHPSISTPTPSTTLSQQFPEGPRGPSNPFSAPSFREPPFRENPFSTQQPPSSVSSDLRSKEFMATHLPAQSPRSAVPPPFHSGPTVSANSSFTPRAEPPQPPRSPDIDPTRQNFSTMARNSVSTYRDDPYQYPSSSVGHDSRPPYNRGPEPPYDNTIKRHIGVHEAAKDLGDLREIFGRNAEVAQNWTQRYHQGNRSGFFQDSLPDLNEIEDMLRHSQLAMDNLARIRDVVIQQQTALSDHRARFARVAGEEEYHSRQDSYDASGYGMDAKNLKRRGKAAPPGRCHSCNRAETPEWRRGPDGARTLCNACGLHYAKLTRKMGASKASQIRGSDIRPKNLDIHP